MRLAVPVKVISQRFALPVLILASVVMVVLGKADALLFERLRIAFADVVSPALVANRAACCAIRVGFCRRASWRASSREIRFAGC